jgi:hypothetical protein
LKDISIQSERKKCFEEDAFIAHKTQELCTFYTTNPYGMNQSFPFRQKCNP